VSLAQNEAAPAAAKGGLLKKEIGFGRKREKHPRGGPERSDAAQDPRGPKPARADKAARQAPAEVRAERTKAAVKLPEVPLMRSLNLLPKDVKLAKTTIRPAFAHAAVLAVALLVAGGMGFLYYTKAGQVTQRQSNVEDLEAQIAAIQSVQPEDDEGDDRSALAGEALARATALSSAIEGRVGWDRLLRELSLTLPEDVWFDKMSTASAAPATPDVNAQAPVAESVSASSLTIGGYAMDQEGIAQLLARLEAIPEFSSVQLQTAARVVVADTPVIQFTITGALK
jgi:Tfp pilus assembly protein PilN